MSAVEARDETTTSIRVVVNGTPVSAQVEARTSLADFLRDAQHLTGTHVSCEQGVCGACTLLLDGRPVRSCITWASACDGATVQTIEGFDDDPAMRALREAFSREHALQCGFCTPGMLVTARDIVRRLPGIDEERLRYELAGNLCRCTGYAGIVRAVSSVALAEGERAAKVDAPPPVAPQEGFVTFDAREDDEALAAAGPRSGTASHASGAPAGSGPQIVESLLVRGCDPARLWQLLGDVAAAASCLPGASVDRFDGREIEGTVRIAFGPITARFSGVGTVERDEASRTTVIRGGGRDPLSKTEAQANIEYRVSPVEDDATAARLTIGMDYVVQGPLAQFSRSELVRSLVAQIVLEFGRNLESLAAGREVSAGQAAGLSATGLLWRWLKQRLSRLFGGGRGGDR